MKKAYGYLFVEDNNDIDTIQFLNGEEVINGDESVLKIIEQIKKMTEITGYIYTLI